MFLLALYIPFIVTCMATMCHIRHFQWTPLPSKDLDVGMCLSQNQNHNKSLPKSSFIIRRGSCSKRTSLTRLAKSFNYSELFTSWASISHDSVLVGPSSVGKFPLALHPTSINSLRVTVAQHGEQRKVLPRKWQRDHDERTMTTTTLCQEG